MATRSNGGGQKALDQAKRHFREPTGGFEAVINPRGKGLMCAFDLPSTAYRHHVKEATYEEGAIVGWGGQQHPLPDAAHRRISNRNRVKFRL